MKPRIKKTQIEHFTRVENTYFKFPFVNTELRLKLVRVHTEYLANL